MDLVPMHRTVSADHKQKQDHSPFGEMTPLVAKEAQRCQVLIVTGNFG